MRNYKDSLELGLHFIFYIEVKNKTIVDINCHVGQHLWYAKIHNTSKLKIKKIHVVINKYQIEGNNDEL